MKFYNVVDDEDIFLGIIKENVGHSDWMFNGGYAVDFDNNIIASVDWNDDGTCDVEIY